MEKYGRLIVVGESPHVGGRPGVLCRCECGTVLAVQRKRLRSGHTQSCGCLQKQRALENSRSLQERSKTHGHSHTFEWKAWMRLRSRTRYGGAKSAERYIGRGISVHPQWDESFEAFLRDVGPAPSEKHSIDRIDSNGDYEPGNVRWATASEQNRNKADNRLFLWEGRQITVAEGAEISGVPYQTLWYRIVRAGMDPKEAMSAPVRRYGR